jgi:uroporphyrinogen III methyltransferase/synthase
MTGARGKVYLVGGGPGDVAYLTVRAQQLLARAEVLVHDALADVGALPESPLLQLVPASAEVLDVGKRGGQPSTPQSEINRLLVGLCKAGKQVVRLKSGDPFIFGRCASEIQALIEANCDFEVVPGISSALAAPLLAGIPLTDPVLSRCFAVASAHDLDALDWETLVLIETLVFLMGGRSLSEIVRMLHRHGLPPDSKVAVIRSCSHPEQQVWTGTLSDIVQKTAGQSLSPAVIVIGQVVGLRDFLIQDTQPEYKIENPKSKMPNPQQPLSGKTILVTRAAGQSGEFTERLHSAGAAVIEMPAIEIGPPSSWEQLDSAISRLQEFDWLILTSTNGVDYFFERLAAGGKDARALGGVKIAVVGEKTAVSLQQRCLQPDFIPPNFVADALVANFPESVADKKILFPRVETGGREVLVKELTGQGAEVVEVPAYESRCPEAIAPAAWEALQQRKVDVITFASSKTVKNFCQLVEGAGAGADGVAPLLEGVCLASIGPQTSKTCRELLGRVDVEAREYTLEGLTQAIVEWATAY